MPLLIVEPQILNFKVDPDTNIIDKAPTIMKLINSTTNDVMIFKIKTNAPRYFCVRPNCGILEPNARIDVQIIAMPLTVKPNNIHKYKFMVQSALAPKEMDDDIAEALNKLSPDEIMEFKVRCLFKYTSGTHINKLEDETDQNKDTAKRVTVDDDDKLKESAEAFTQTEEEGNNDNHKSGSVIPDSRTFLETEIDIVKIYSEIFNLRGTEKVLRRQNSEMEEELVRLRTVPLPETSAQGMFKPWLAVAMVLLGVIIGKFFM